MDANDLWPLLIVGWLVFFFGILVGKRGERWEWTSSAHSHHNSHKSNGVWYYVMPNPSSKEESAQCLLLDKLYGGSQYNWRDVEINRLANRSMKVE